MKVKNRVLSSLFVLLLMAIPVFCVSEKDQTITDTSISSSNAATEKPNKTTVNQKAGYFKDMSELTNIVNAINQINDNFVGKSTPTKDEMYEAAIAGIVSSLNDPYSEYLSKKSLKEFQEDLGGEYVGVGMSIEKANGSPLVVVSPFVGSPAAKAGIKIGDRIIKIDGQDILPLSSTEAVSKLKGSKGTKVNVELLRENIEKPIELTLIRDTIKLEVVESKMLENKIGYVSLLRFGEKTGEEVKEHIVELQKQGMKALIFDLRSNPGGSLQEAQDITSLFTTEKVVTSLKYKDGSQRSYNRTNKNLGNFPLVILVNKGSASASEIVTGAIKDYKRGLIIGQKTFGKGIVQQVIPLERQDAIKLTIAQYFTPNGHYIHEKGIEPDIVVEMDDVLSIKGYANNSDEAKENQMQEIKNYLIKMHGEEEAMKIINAGDVQLKRALEEIKKMMKK